MTESKNGISRKRDYLPGDKWLYFKIYCGVGTIDDVLCGPISRALNEFRSRAYISRWFFIRYSDPDFHLRLRLELSSAEHIGDIILLLKQKLISYIKSGQIYRIVIDTYCREIERYGGWRLMDTSETLFCHDSELVLLILQQLKASNKLDERWKLAFIIVDRLLGVINPDTEERLNIAKSQSESYMREFKIKSSNDQISRIYRKYKNEIELLLISNSEYLNELKLSNAFAQWEELVISCLSDPKTRKNIRMASVIHMCLNRLFASSNRMNEMMVYNSLSRYYSSIIARENKRKSIKQL